MNIISIPVVHIKRITVLAMEIFIANGLNYVTTKHATTLLVIFANLKVQLLSDHESVYVAVREEFTGRSYMNCNKECFEQNLNLTK